MANFLFFRRVNNCTKISILTFVLFTLTSCSNKENYIKSRAWVFWDGSKVGEGDYIDFEPGDSMIDFRNDTFFYRGKPKSILTSINKITKSIKIKDITTGKIGIYRSKGERSLFWESSDDSPDSTEKSPI